MSEYQKERREHPEFSPEQIRRIVADHKKTSIRAEIRKGSAKQSLHTIRLIWLNPREYRRVRKEMKIF